MNKNKLLLIDDDIRYSQILKINLSHFFIIDHVPNIELAFESLGKNEYDGIILDLNLDLPQSGKNYFIKLQKKFEKPIFILTTDESYETKLDLLKIGAHDYLWKTMSNDEIYFRINNQINHGKKSYITPANVSVEISDLRLNSRNLTALYKNTEIYLTRNEFKILLELFSHYPENCLKHDFIATIWTNQKISDGVFSTALYQLNKKLDLWTHRISSQRESIGFIKK